MRHNSSLLALILAIVLVVAAPLVAQTGRATGRMFQIDVQSNVASATLFVNGEAQKPGMPVRVVIPPGTYTFEVRAPGYVDFTQTVNVSRSQTIVATLQPLTATVTVEVPAPYRAPARPGVSPLRVFVDGAEIARPLEPFAVNPGQRVIAVEAGTLRTESRFTFESGRTYVIQPIPGLQLGSSATAVAPAPSAAPSAPAPATPATIALSLESGYTGVLGRAGSASDTLRFIVQIPTNFNYRVNVTEQDMSGRVFIQLFRSPDFTGEIDATTNPAGSDFPPVGGIQHARNFVLSPGTYFLQVRNGDASGDTPVSIRMFSYDRQYDSER